MNCVTTAKLKFRYNKLNSVLKFIMVEVVLSFRDILSVYENSLYECENGRKMSITQKLTANSRHKKVLLTARNLKF